jgi:hypothetical protein
MEFYRGVRVAPWTRALRYAIWFHFMLAFIATFVLMPAALVARTQLLAHIKTAIPDNAAISVHGGVLSTTLASPFELGDDNLHVIVDDTRTGTAYPDVISKSTGVFFGRDTIFMTDDQDQQHTYALRQAPDVTLTKSGVLDWLTRYGILAIVLGSLLFGFLYWGLLFAVSFFTVVVFTLLSLLFAKMWKVSLSYKQLFATGLHAVTLPIMANLCLGAFGVNIPYAYTVIFFLIISAVISDERSQPVGGVKNGGQKAEPVAGPPEPKPEDEKPREDETKK